MNQSRRWYVIALLIPATFLSNVRGQKQKSDEKPAETKWLVDRSLVVTAAPAPVPALKYRLFPSTMELKPGNAVPIYLRFAHERTDARKKELREKPAEWNKLPLEKLPLAEVKALLDSYKYNFQQLDLGARRKTADWSHTVDAGNPIGILLPDMQEMRIHAPLLVLKARVAIAEGRYADAIRTLETGFSFAQQISEGRFLISSLVGFACASLFADCALELIERADGPNLYWALAVLPRPLFDLRNGFEFEMMLPEMQFPDLADLNRPRAPEEWDLTLKRVRTQIEELMKDDKNLIPRKPGTKSTDPAAKSPDLPAARKYLTEVVGLSAANVDAMPAAQVLLLHISHYYHEIRDDVFKGTYLPFPQGWAASNSGRDTVRALKSLPDIEAAWLPRYLMPAVTKVRLANMRIQRKLAAMHVIEALRMHAAAHDGQLPDTLQQVAVVPVPDDPGTGKPFEYNRDGKTATLISRIPGEPLESTGMRYRITVRK
jgi:hypothetical protein